MNVNERVVDIWRKIARGVYTQLGDCVNTYIGFSIISKQEKRSFRQKRWMDGNARWMDWREGGRGERAEG